MIRGTCQQFKFKIPYQLSQLKTVRITFWQPDNEGTEDCALPITKVLTDCTEDAASRTVYVTLNQVETLAFNTDEKAFVQFRALTTDGFAFGCKKKPITVYPIQDDTVLE